MRIVTELEACGEIASRTILQACDDYFVCKRKLEKGENKASGIYNCQKLLDECIDFFNSPQYDLFTNGNPALSGVRVMKQIDSMVEDKATYPNDFSPFKGRLDTEQGEEQE